MFDKFHLKKGKKKYVSPFIKYIFSSAIAKASRVLNSFSNMCVTNLK